MIFLPSILQEQVSKKINERKGILLQEPLPLTVYLQCVVKYFLVISNILSGQIATRSSYSCKSARYGAAYNNTHSL